MLSLRKSLSAALNLHIRSPMILQFITITKCLVFFCWSQVSYRMVAMASFNNLALLALALVLSVQGTLGEITCEKLDQETCSYAISSTGKRCVLETHMKRSGEESYTCRTSEIEADKLRNWVETDECIKACGLDRKSLGIASDSLIESDFTMQLCSPQCYDSCTNIVDLYFNLAAGEGVFLPRLCETTKKANERRGLMTDIHSSTLAVSAPIPKVKNTFLPVYAPTPSPTPAPPMPPPPPPPPVY